MSIRNKLENMVHLLELEIQKIRFEIQKIMDQAHSPHLSKENALKIKTVMQDLIKQAEHIESLKSEVTKQLHPN